jgi:predicted nucleic acid-binding protein
MPRYFFDTSALVKNYHAEVGTADVQRILGEAGSEFLISRLATVEMLLGFAGKVRTGALSSIDFSRLRRRFLADVGKRLLRPIRVLNVHYQIAGELIGKHAMSRQLRTLDALQLAIALHFDQSSPVNYFVCADQRLCDVAALERLPVITPA